jgi:hypothetical protein
MRIWYRLGHEAGLNGAAPAFLPWRGSAPYWLGYLVGRRRLKQCAALMAETIADLPLSTSRATTSRAADRD